jgi:hypothetical protein
VLNPFTKRSSHSFGLSRIRFEKHAHARDGVEQVRPRWILFELATQPMHGDAHYV